MVSDRVNIEPNKVVGVKLTPGGRVDFIEDFMSMTWLTFTPVSFYQGTDTPPSYLYFGWTISAVNLVGELHTIALGAGTEGTELDPTLGACVVLAQDGVLILESDGTPSTKTLTWLRSNPGAINYVFYVLKGGLRTAQIIMLAPVP